MGGGIIIQRNALLRPAINDSSIYPFLSDEDRSHVEALNQKSPGQITEQDIEWMAEKIREVCGCDGD
jgi:hypothetical protein